MEAFKHGLPELKAAAQADLGRIDITLGKCGAHARGGLHHSRRLQHEEYDAYVGMEDGRCFGILFQSWGRQA